MSTTPTTITTATPDMHTFMGAMLAPTGDYALDCMDMAAQALSGAGFENAKARPEFSAIVTCEDGDDTVACGVIVLDPDAYETTIGDVEGLVCREMVAELAGVSLLLALDTYGNLPMSLRADVISVCLDAGNARARVHHVRNVWHS